MQKKKILILEGLSRVGKTTLAKRLIQLAPESAMYIIEARPENFWDKNFSEKCKEIANRTLNLLISSQYNCFVLDRFYPSEYVFCRLYNRPFDFSFYKAYDEEVFKLGAQIIYCTTSNLLLRNLLKESTKPTQTLRELGFMRKYYTEFFKWSKLSYIQVDPFLLYSDEVIAKLWDLVIEKGSRNL